jgi:lipoprotein-anchoring transpeptidase ErfK/SrfK
VGPTDKWVSVRVTRGTLVAYEGDTPVFAAAISPGVDGIGQGDHATRRGLYTIGWKMMSYDMSGEDHGTPWTVKDVPWVAYYKGSYALHGAWWHDGFGRPMSHGCINLPPLDARFLFGWLDPVVPEGWYAAASYYPYVKGTVVEIRP